MSNPTTPREAESQKFIGAVNRQIGVVVCLTCESHQTVDLDEDGGAAIDQTPCHADDCTAMLCTNCPQFTCDGCGLAHCASHVAIESDGVKLCSVCAAQDADTPPEPEHDDSVRCCPDCERPNQFGELCTECERERERERNHCTEAV